MHVYRGHKRLSETSRSAEGGGDVFISSIRKECETRSWCHCEEGGEIGW